MSLWKRLKNLWDLSGMDWDATIYKPRSVGPTYTAPFWPNYLPVTKKMATVIEPNTYADDIPTEPKDI